MPKMTLLAITQDILSDMSGDYVNSISDTDEAEQVAQIVKNVYYDLIESKHNKWEHLKATTTLDSAGDLTKPTHMKLNADVYNVDFIRYNKEKSTDTRSKYDSVMYLTPDDFLDKLNARDESQSNYTVVTDYGGIELIVRTDLPPTYYTSFDNTYFVFDSYDSGVESTLQSSKTQAYVTKIPSWTHTDAFIPDLPPQAFGLLLSEAKSVCWNALKQLPNAKEEQRAARQRRNINLNSHQISTNQKPMVYGRRTRK